MNNVNVVPKMRIVVPPVDISLINYNDEMTIHSGNCFDDHLWMRIVMNGDIEEPPPPRKRLTGHVMQIFKGRDLFSEIPVQPRCTMFLSSLFSRDRSFKIPYLTGDQYAICHIELYSATFSLIKAIWDQHVYKYSLTGASCLCFHCPLRYIMQQYQCQGRTTTCKGALNKLRVNR